MVKRCALSTGYMPQGGLPRNIVDRITDCPDMTSAVDRGRKASTQTNKQKVNRFSCDTGHELYDSYCNLHIYTKKCDIANGIFMPVLITACSRY